MDQTDQLARAITAHGAGRLEEADGLYRRVLKEQPDHPEALHLLGVAAAQRGRHEDAVALISNAIRISADVPAYHCNLGNALFEQGLLDRALAAYDRALALDGANADAHYNKANVLRDQGRADAALESYRTATTLQPKFADAWCNFGAELSRLDRLEEAETCFRKALAARAGHLQALHGLGDVLRVAGRLEEAKERFEEVLRRQPDMVDAWVGLGRVLAARNDPHGAADSFAKALEQRPSDARALRGLGRAAMQQGRFDVAAHCFERALNTNPEDLETRVGLAYIRVCQGQAHEALDLTNGVLEADPDHWDALAVRSAALGALGRKSEAIATTERAVGIRPVHETPSAGRTHATILILRSMGNEYLRLDGKFGVRQMNSNNVAGHLDRDEFAICQALVDDGFLEDIVPKLPHFDLVYNAITEPDYCGHSLGIAQQFVATLDCPVINRPDRVLLTTRDRMERRLRDWAGPSLPLTVRHQLGRDAVAGLMRIMEEDGFEFPIIVREVGTHTGSTMIRIDDPEMLARHAASYVGREVYVIQYKECAIRDGFYRRLRFFSIDGRLYPSNLHFANHWNVHGAGRRTLMKTHAWMEQQELSFTTAPVEFVGQANFDVLTGMHEVVGLDYFGIDFAMNESGDVTLFEVNAAMSFPAERAIGFSHLDQSYGAIVAAFNDMARNRIRASNPSVTRRDVGHVGPKSGCEGG